VLHRLDRLRYKQLLPFWRYGNFKAHPAGCIHTPGTGGANNGADFPVPPRSTDPADLSLHYLQSSNFSFSEYFRLLSFGSVGVGKGQGVGVDVPVLLVPTRANHAFGIKVGRHFPDFFGTQYPGVDSKGILEFNIFPELA